MKSFDVPEEDQAERKPEPFQLPNRDRTGKDTYLAYPPKLAMLTDLGVIVTTVEEGGELGYNEIMSAMDFVHECMTEESAIAISDRLRDVSDFLDYPHLVPVMQWLMEIAGKDRGTSSPASAPSVKPAGRTSTASSRRKRASTSGPSKRIST